MTITETVAGALTARKNEFVRAYNAGSGADMAAQYTADAQLLPPGSQIVSGHEGIAEYWESLMREGGVTVALDTTELLVDGALAVTAGGYVLSDRDGREVDSGKFIVVWRQESGEWWAHRDIWNSNAAPGGERS